MKVQYDDEGHPVIETVLIDMLEEADHMRNYRDRPLDAIIQEERIHDLMLFLMENEYSFIAPRLKALEHQLLGQMADRAIRGYY